MSSTPPPASLLRPSLPSLPRSRTLDDSLPSSDLPDLALPIQGPELSDSEEEGDELSPPPPSHSSHHSHPSSDDDSQSTSSLVPKKRKLYVRKKPVLGPAGRKSFLEEGLYASSSSYRQPSLLVPKLEDSKPPPPAATAEEPKKSKRFKPFVGYETILPDGTAVEGKLDLNAPVEGEARLVAAVAGGSSSSAEPSARDARSRLRSRLSLPATLPPTPIIPPPPAPSHAINHFLQIVPSSSLPSVVAPPLPPIPVGGVLNGTRSRPRASLPAPPPKPFSQPKASTSKPPATKEPSKPFSFPLPNPFSFPLPQPPSLLRHSGHFALPYDIRWEVENGAIKRKKKENVPGKYVRLAQNTFPERGKDMDPTGPAICSCVLPKGKDEEGCGEGCMNRMMQYLCHPKTCPCGDRCSNKSLYKRKSPNIKIFWTGNRGFGLQAVEKIPEGTFVIDYRGEIIEISTYYDRILTDYADRNDYYALEYGEGEVIDAGHKGNAARFINHGCSPNLEVHKLTTLGSGVEEYEVGLWASRDIEPGEELFYDYNFDSFGDRPSKPSKSTSSSSKLEPTSPSAIASTLPSVLAKAPGTGRQRCNCGAKACTGWIGGSAAAATDAKGKGKEKEKEVAVGEGAKPKPKGRPKSKTKIKVVKGKGKAALLIAAVKGGGKKGKGRDAVTKSKLLGGAGGGKKGTLKLKSQGGKGRKK